MCVCVCVCVFVCVCVRVRESVCEGGRERERVCVKSDRKCGSQSQRVCVCVFACVVSRSTPTHGSARISPALEDRRVRASPACIGQRRLQRVGKGLPTLPRVSPQKIAVARRPCLAPPTSSSLLAGDLNMFFSESTSCRCTDAVSPEIDGFSTPYCTGLL